MNDDDLRRHLERRADASGPPPEFRPAVRQAMASPPRHTSTSPLPAFAGLAATISVLLAVAVAMPRIAPQTPAASASSGPPSPAVESPSPGNAVSCHSPIEQQYEPVIIDETGRVTSCTFTGATTGAGIGDGRPSVANPDGDLSSLRIAWSGTPCDAAARITLRESTEGLTVETVLPSVPCEAMGVYHSLVVQLDQSVDASVIAVSAMTRSAAAAAWWELAPDERPTAESTELDLVVYERACAGGQSPDGRVMEPDIDSDGDAVTITFSVAPLPGEGDCPMAPGAPYTVQLSGPLGDRRLVDGDELAGDVVLEQTDDFLALATHRVDEYASERFEAMFGAEGCRVTSTTDRYVPTDAEVQAAVEALGGSDGHIPGGGYVSEEWISAARALGAVEAYAGRPKPWYILTSSFDGSPALRSLSPTTVAGRTIWNPSDQARLPNGDCEGPTPNPPAVEIDCADPVDRIGATVIDHAGVVAACATVEPNGRGMTPREPPRITNPGGNNRRLLIQWSGNPCSAAVGWTLNETSDGWSLALGPRPDGQHLGAELDDGTIVCIQPLVQHAIRLDLNSEIDAALVVLSDPAAPMPAPSPEPRTLECFGDDGIVLLEDFSGHLDRCEVDQAGSAPAELVSINDGGAGANRINVTWRAASGCPDPYTLRIWNLQRYPDAGLEGVSPRYLVQVDRTAPSRGLALLPCLGIDLGKAVTLTFAEPVVASDVEAFVTMPDGRGVDTGAMGGASDFFRLDIAANKRLYTAGESVDVTASLTMVDDVTVSCLSGLLIGLEQLDGPLGFNPGPFTMACSPPRELRSTDEVTTGFLPAVWGWREPHPLDPYMRDGKLYLAAGTYRFSAIASFSIGEVGPGERVELEASVVVEVR